VLGLSPERAVTLSFLTLSLSRLFHVLNMRDYSTTIFRNEIVRNPWIWAAVVICMALLFLALYVPFLADLFSLHPPSLQGWILVLGMSILPTIAGQIWIGIKQKK
jgi:Ca2+-transporting ATPase